MKSWTCLAAAAAALVTAVSAEPGQLFNKYGLYSYEADQEVGLEVNIPGGSQQVFRVVPLTTYLGLNQSAGLVGGLVQATSNNYLSIVSTSSIALLSCDNDTTSFIDNQSIFEALMQQQPGAIVLYSTSKNSCGVTEPDALTYPNIVSMISSSNAADVLNITSAFGDERPIDTAITTYSLTNRGSNRTSIAMSILYTITALVTLLFIAIIAAGALRAHRNPERYGPRVAQGQQRRQTRAKGLARAVLETLPIIKFGNSEPAKPDPGLELESGRNSQVDVAARTVPDATTLHMTAIPETPAPRSEVARTEPATQAPTPTMPATQTVSAPPAPTDNTTTEAAKEPTETTTTKTTETTTTETTTTETTTTETTTTDSDDRLGCSICTEDFEVGQDVRVLPCDHKFHPHCVDHWLVNVSGTCPMCRLDLRPKAKDAQPTTDGETLAPPLGASGAPGAPLAPPMGPDGPEQGVAAETSGVRRGSRLFDLHRLRNVSAEERIAGLRQFRAEQVTQPQAAAPHDRETLTQRLRERFRVRTRAQSDAGSRPPQ